MDSLLGQPPLMITPELVVHPPATGFLILPPADRLVVRQALLASGRIALDPRLLLAAALLALQLVLELQMLPPELVTHLLLLVLHPVLHLPTLHILQVAHRVESARRRHGGTPF